MKGTEILLHSKHIISSLTRWRQQDIQETLVRSPGWDNPLEKEMAPHSSVLAWRIPWTEEPGGLQSMGSQRVRHN